jgi:hypothetical protein
MSFSDNYDYKDELQDEVYDNLNIFSNNIVNIMRLVKQIGTSSDKSDLRSNIKTMIDETTIVGKTVAQNLKGVTRGIKRNKLTTDYQAWLSKLNDVGKEYLLKIKTSEKRNDFTTSSYSTFPGDDSGISYHTFPEEVSLQKSQFLQIENDRQFNDMMIQERYKDIKAVETRTIEINQMFNDLSLLIHRDGEYIDNIESNILSASYNVEDGVEEVIIAERNQKNSRNKLCCIAITITVVLTIGILILVILTR